MQKPGPTAQVYGVEGNRAEGAELFAPLDPITRFQRLALVGSSYPGRCPGLLHFAPLALRIKNKLRVPHVQKRTAISSVRLFRLRPNAGNVFAARRTLARWRDFHLAN